MRKSSFKETFQRFFERSIWYSEFLKKISAHTTLLYNEKTEIFEAFCPKIYTNWECLVEDLLIDCLNRDTSKYAKYKDIPLPPHSTRGQCEAFISGLGYFDFRSTGDIKGIAKNILVPNFNPFLHIPTNDGHMIDEFCAIRRYLAHYSRSAKQSLKQLYMTKHGFQHFREPGRFLLANARKAKQSRILDYSHAFFNAADAMAEVLKVN